MLARLGEAGLVFGRTLGIDASTLKAHAAIRPLERCDSGQRYPDCLQALARAEGIENPAKEDCAGLDKKRKNKARNQDWVHPHDCDARITKMKDSRTHLGYKDEHAVDLDTGAIVAVTVQPGDTGDCESLPVTQEQAQAGLVALRAPGMQVACPEPESKKRWPQGLPQRRGAKVLRRKKIRTYVSEPRRKRKWKGNPAQKKQAQANHRRVKGKRGKRRL